MRKRMEPAGMEPLEYERHGWASRRPRERERMSQLASQGAVGFIDWLDRASDHI
jgi:hypothetical protein